MTMTGQHYSARLLQAELEKYDYTFETYVLDEKSYTRFVAPSGRSWLTQNACTGYPFTHAAILKVCRNKYLAHEFAERLGVRSPETIQIVGTLTDEQMLQHLKRAPLVVKPSDSHQSNGVTLQVRTLPVLKTALATAHAFSDIALLQSQVDGDEIRFVVFDGVVKAALLRQTARITGDGENSLGALLAAENKSRAALTMPYLTYPQLDETLVDFASFDTNEVLADGKVLELNRGTMIRTGASVYNVFDAVHPSYIATASKLATALGARFVVVDMIIKNYELAQANDNYAFLEFNTSPVLKLFYSCRDGKHFDVLKELAQVIDDTIESKYE